MSRVKLGLKDLHPAGRVALAVQIHSAMTTNAALFPGANPTMPAYNTLITTAQTKMAAYDTIIAASAVALAERDEALVAMDAGTTQEGAYVQNASGGDAALILKAGMGVAADRTPVGPMPRVLELLLSEGDHSGYLDAMWKPVYGAKSYEIQISSDPMSETTWVFKMSSGKSSATLTGLTPGAKVWVRVRAMGANPLPGDWSDPAMKVVP